MRKLMGVVLFATVLVLTACGNDESKDKKHMESIKVALEDITKLENEIMTIQKPLRNYERVEEALFSEMIELGKDKKGELKSKSLEAIEMAKQRKRAMEDESIRLEKMTSVIEIIKNESDEIKVQSLSRLTKELVAIGTEKNEIYEGLVKEYIKAAELDINMYQTTGDSSTKIADFENMLLQLSEQYQVVNSMQDGFNKSSQEFTLKKKELYEKAGYDIETK